MSLPQDMQTSLLHAINAAAEQLANACRWRGVAEAALHAEAALRERLAEYEARIAELEAQVASAAPEPEPDPGKAAGQAMGSALGSLHGGGRD